MVMLNYDLDHLLNDVLILVCFDPMFFCFVRILIKYIIVNYGYHLSDDDKDHSIDASIDYIIIMSRNLFWS